MERCKARLKQISWSPIRLFLLLMGIMAVLSLMKIFASRGYALAGTLYSGGKTLGWDLYFHILYVRDPAQVYFTSHHACFPPLAYVFYLALKHISTVDFKVPGVDVYNVSFEALPQLYFILICCLFTLLLFVLLSLWLKKYPLRQRVLVMLLIMLSTVFVAGLIERGNLITLVILLMLAALLLKDADSPALRELALLLIATAAGLKLYPALLGILYLKERRWKEAGRLVAYGLILFFLPFLLFGGAAGFVQFVKNLMEVSAVEPLAESWLGRIYLWVVGERPVDEARFRTLQTVVSALLAAGMLLCVFLDRQKSSWRSVSLLTAIMILCPAWSGPYTPGLMLAPLAMFLAEEDGPLTFWNALPCVAFFIIFIVWYFPVWDGMYIPFYGVLLLAAAVCAETLARGRRRPVASISR